LEQEAEALEKPGSPTFFETPAWSFNMGVKFLLGSGVFQARFTAAQISSPP
jgi:hypothetical protein